MTTEAFALSKQTEQQRFTIRRVTWVGLVVNLALSALKLLLGIVGNSQALVADAVHSLSDVSTDLAILFGVRYWTAPADAEHPYGHARFETLVTNFIAIVMAVAGAGIGLHALRGFFVIHHEGPRMIALYGALASIIVKEWLYRWTSAVGKRIRSSALVANAWHHRSDAFSSIPVLVAVIASAINPRLAFLDHLGAVLVSLFILWAAGKLLAGTLREMTGQGADRAKYGEMSTLAGRIPGVMSVHAVRSRLLGQGLFVDLHIMVDPNLTVRAGHDISEAVKKRLLDEMNDVVDVVVHLEPYEPPTEHRE